jgi:membrane protein DedA with SNARE-associated domain
MGDWIINLIERMGYLGIALLMFLENHLFPPIPSELIMPLSGFTASRGNLNIVGVIVAGSLGSVGGALFWYYVGRWVGDDRLKRWADRHGRWITMTARDVATADRWFDRHCHWAVLIGRLIPTVRTLISIPAGIFEMGVRRFLIFSTIGTLIWSAALAGAGYALGGEYETVSRYLGPVSTGVVVLIVAVYLYRVATFKPRPRQR